MTRALICTGVLGGGTAVVFALAATVSMLFPNGTMVSGGYWGGKGGMFIEQAIPVPMPALDQVVIEVPAEGAEK
jgi:hypothetical protein